MIKDNQKVFNRLLVIIDALITAVSFVLAYYIKFYILNDGPGIGVLPVQDYYMLLPFIVPGYMFLYYRCSVYSPKRTVRRRHEIYSILQANTIGLAALIIILYMIIREINFSRSVMAIFYVLNVFQRVSQIAVSMFIYLAMFPGGGNAVKVFVLQSCTVLGSNCIPIPGAMGVSDYLMLDCFGRVPVPSGAGNLELLSRAVSFYFCILICGIAMLAKFYIIKRRRNRL